MKISVAQTRPLTGDITGNISAHCKLIGLAIAEKANLIVFPELSLTGYEPSLAAALATTVDDTRLEVFQEISNSSNIIIGVGLPTKVLSGGVNITMIIFQPRMPRRTYSKKYLHADEEPFFVSGSNFSCLEVLKTKVSLAICYELSVPAHSADALEDGGEVYLASVAKTARGVANASAQLADIAAKYEVPTLMANCIGVNDGEICTGGTAVWNRDGVLVTQMNDKTEGVIVFNTITNEAVVKPL